MMKYFYSILVIVIFAIGFMASDADDNSGGGDGGNDSNQQEVKQENDSNQQEIKHEFFENGYKYYASFRVNIERGWGVSCNYTYIIRIYDDGTKVISRITLPDGGSLGSSETYSCNIEKKSSSYGDVSVTWYKVEFTEDSFYVDEDGNVIILGVNGDIKTIQEAISTQDCIFGKFSKEVLGNEVYICKTCGEEYDPTKESVYDEDYCYKDCPQICKYCEKTFTAREEGSGACVNVCANCYRKQQYKQLFEQVTGRDIETFGRY